MSDYSKKAVYSCSSLLTADVPQQRQSPEPLLLHPFQKLSATKKEAEVHHMTKSYNSLTFLLPSSTSQSALEFGGRY